ncbi:fused MFS/spermidine synthase [Candidatus Sumerlaeota bacterium]|nr:fused MFS/spermidine synthase [Candidatus Sumerlaeota bacterium]
MDAPARARHSSGTYVMLCACMFVSGVAGLIYQLVWSRYLGLFVGSSGRAQIIVLATFMGGLGAGSFLFGRRADATRDSLRLYGMLEVGIAVLGLVYPLLFEPTRGLFLTIVRHLGLSPFALGVAASIVCALTILLPTMLMGGTLPVLGRYLISSPQLVGRRIAVLYYINSLGAVLGTILTGFFLLRMVGLHGTIVIAALLNLMAAAGAFIVRGREGEIDVQPQGDIAPDPEPRAMQVTDRVVTVTMIAITLSGTAAFFLEIAWVRMMTLVLGSASNSFALMLAAFISGISIGSFILSFKKTDEAYPTILGWSLVAVGLTTLLTLFGYERLPVLLNQWLTSFERTEANYKWFQLVSFLLCFSVMVIPTVFMGLTLPAASRIASQAVSSVGRKVGGVFAVNTIGSLAGAVVGGFVLLPLIGIRHLIEFAVAIDVILGLSILFTDAKANGRFIATWKAAMIATILVVVIYFVGVPQWDLRMFTAGTYRSQARLEDVNELRTLTSDRDIIFYRDGKDATITVLEDTNQLGIEPKKKVLMINGKPDASTSLDMYTQMMLPHLAMMMHPDPQNVLVVGFGSGVTIGTASLYNPKLAECVELIPEVIEAGEKFSAYNHDVLNNPNVKIIIQDAKTHMQVSPHQYDVIISEPTNPWISGVASLFSREFMLTTRSKLKPGGFFVQWFHSYEIKDESLFSILNTFNEVFPYSILYNQMGTDVAVVGSTVPFEPNFPRMEKALAQPLVAQDLRRFGIDGLLPVLSMQLAVKNNSPAPYATIGGTNSDFFPRLEYDAQVGFFLSRGSRMMVLLDRRLTARPISDLWITRYTPSEAPKEKVFESYFRTLQKTSPSRRLSLIWCNLWETYFPDSKSLAAARMELEKAEPISLEVPDPLPERLRMEYYLYFRNCSYAGIVDSTRLEAVCREVIEGNHEDKSVALGMLGDVFRNRGDLSGAHDFYMKALETLKINASADQRPRDRLLLRIADVESMAGNFNGARGMLKTIPRHADYSDAFTYAADIMECRIAQREQQR